MACTYGTHYTAGFNVAATTTIKAAAFKGHGARVVVSMPPSVEPGKKAPTTPAVAYDQEKAPSWYRRQFLLARLNDMDAQIRELREYRSITAYMVGEVVIPNFAGAPLNDEDQIKQIEVQRRDIALSIR